jgi:exodeoxyribonuclease VII large subunit
VSRHRTRLHQHTRELRAAARRATTERLRETERRVRAVERRRQAARLAASRGDARVRADASGLATRRVGAVDRRRVELERFARMLDAHDPQRTLERGYALVEDPSGGPITSAAAARAAGALVVRMHDGRIPVAPPPPPISS